MITNRQIALIHVAKSRVGMSELEYREMLSSFGVSSSKELSGAQFERVMRHFKKIGFAPRIAAGSRSHNKKARPPATSRDLLRGKVRRLMAEIGLTESYVDAMARHMFKTDSWRWLDAERLHKLAAALTYHLRRKQRAAGNG